MSTYNPSNDSNIGMPDMLSVFLDLCIYIYLSTSHALILHLGQVSKPILTSTQFKFSI